MSCAQFLMSQINEGRDVQKETRCGTSGFWLCKSSCAGRERSGENHDIFVEIFVFKLRKSIYNDISSELKYLLLKTKHVFSK